MVIIRWKGYQVMHRCHYYLLEHDFTLSCIYFQIWRHGFRVKTHYIGRGAIQRGKVHLHQVPHWYVPTVTCWIQAQGWIIAKGRKKGNTKGWLIAKGEKKTKPRAESKPRVGRSEKPGQNSSQGLTTEKNQGLDIILLFTSPICNA